MRPVRYPHPSPTATLQSGAVIQHQHTEYTPSQVTSYLEKICYHQYQHEIDYTSPQARLQMLQLIMRLHVCSFPWENTGMHYSRTHIQDISTNAVFERLVIDEKGGTYCFGHNLLLCGVLRALGFRCYTSLARVVFDIAPDSELPAMTHAVILVQPFHDKRERETYLVDVGFGGSGLMRPILLADLPENYVFGTDRNEMHRLVKKCIRGSALCDSSFDWELQCQRPNHVPEWRSLYTFGETEALITDHIHSNIALCLDPTSQKFIRRNVVCCKHFFADPESGRLDGDIGKYLLVGDKLKQSVGDQSQTIAEFNSGEEKERLSALGRYFGIFVEEGDMYIYDDPAAL